MEHKIRTDEHGRYYCPYPGCGTTTKSNGELFDSPQSMSGHLARCKYRPVSRQAKIAVERQLRGETVVDGVEDPIAIKVQTAMVQARANMGETVVPKKTKTKTGLGSSPAMQGTNNEDTDGSAIIFPNTEKLSPDAKAMVDFQNALMKSNEKQFEKLAYRLGLGPADAEAHIKANNDAAHDPTQREKERIIPFLPNWVLYVAAGGGILYWMTQSAKEAKARAMCSDRYNEYMDKDGADPIKGQALQEACLRAEMPKSIGEKIQTGLAGMAGYAMREGVRSYMRPAGIMRRFGGR